MHDRHNLSSSMGRELWCLTMASPGSPVPSTLKRIKQDNGAAPDPGPVEGRENFCEEAHQIFTLRKAWGGWVKALSGSVGMSPQCGDVPSLWEILGAVPSALAVEQSKNFSHDNNADFYTFPRTPTSRERGGMARRGFTRTRAVSTRKLHSHRPRMFN